MPGCQRRVANHDLPQRRVQSLDGRHCIRLLENPISRDIQEEDHHLRQPSLVLYLGTVTLLTLQISPAIRKNSRRMVI